MGRPRIRRRSQRKKLPGRRRFLPQQRAPLELSAPQLPRPTRVHPSQAGVFPSPTGAPAPNSRSRRHRSTTDPGPNPNHPALRHSRTPAASGGRCPRRPQFKRLPRPIYTSSSSATYQQTKKSISLAIAEKNHPPPLEKMARGGPSTDQLVAGRASIATFPVDERLVSSPPFSKKCPYEQFSEAAQELSPRLSTHTETHFCLCAETAEASSGLGERSLIDRTMAASTRKSRDADIFRFDDDGRPLSPGVWTN